jgi:hypothetical protein
MTTSPLLLPDAASHAPAAYCLADDRSVSVAVSHGDEVSVLVAEDVGPTADDLAAVFTAGVHVGLPLGAIARRLDDTVRGWDIPPVMATLVRVTDQAFTLLHRGGPMPLLVSESRVLTRVVTELPGPPLGPHAVSTPAVWSDDHTAAPGDVLVVTTPSGVDAVTKALATSDGPTWDDVRYALAHDAGRIAGEAAFAVVRFAPR